MQLAHPRLVALIAMLPLAGCASEAAEPGSSHARRWTNAKGDFATVAAACDASAYIKSSFGASGASFGEAIALSADGTMLAVGMPGDSTDAVGVNPTPGAAEKDGSGAVTIFRCDAGAWSQEAFLKASNAEEYDEFGGSIALSADGTVLAVGATGEASAALAEGGGETDNSADGAGAVYVFRRSAGAWVEEAYLKASNAAKNDDFGGAVSLSADGNTLAVGAEAEDGLDPNGVPDDNAGSSAGAVYVFERDEALGWSESAFLKASLPNAWDRFGSALSLAPDGQSLAVGAWGESSGSDGINSDQHDGATYGAGAVYLFRRTDGRWWEESYIKSANSGSQHFFGYSIALSGDASVLVVGAYGEPSDATGINGDESDSSGRNVGAAYVFRYTETGWVQEAYIKASNSEDQDKFGTRVAVSTDGNVVAVGAPNEDSDGTGFDGDQNDGSADESGAVYVFALGAEGWQQTHYVKAPNTGEDDAFGSSLALSADGTLLLASAPNEASNATTIDGDGTNDSSEYSGACYAIALP